MKPVHILAIETSCDETAVAIVEHAAEHTKVLSNVVSSQADLHARFGGVVPDLAAREHTKNIAPVFEMSLDEAKIRPEDVDAIAVTKGPGLIPALLIGNVAAKTLAYAWNKPLLGIHHIEGHIYANFISNNQSPESNNQKDSGSENIKESEFPLLALVVSGGHTQLVLMRDHFTYEILGETQDDAAGEAFDKVAKMLGLPYPGGPIVAKRAESYTKEEESLEGIFPSPVVLTGVRTRKAKEKCSSKTFLANNHPATPQFPRPMIHSGDFNFSFSGLKTAVLYTIKKQSDQIQNEDFVNEICYQFQEAVIDVLVAKTKKAVEQFQPKTFVIAGGVSANTELRARLKAMIETAFPTTNFLTPEFAYSLDNAAMIAAAAAFRWEKMSDTQRQAAHDSWKTLRPDANLKLQSSL